MDILMLVAELVRFNVDLIEMHCIIWVIAALCAYFLASDDFWRVFRASRRYVGGVRGTAMFWFLFCGAVIVGSFLGELIGLFIGMRFGVDVNTILLDALVFSILIGSTIGSLWLHGKAVTIPAETEAVRQELKRP